MSVRTDFYGSYTSPVLNLAASAALFYSTASGAVSNGSGSITFSNVTAVDVNANNWPVANDTVSQKQATGLVVNSVVFYVTVFFNGSNSPVDCTYEFPGAAYTDTLTYVTEGYEVSKTAEGYLRIRSLIAVTKPLFLRIRLVYGFPSFNMQLKNSTSGTAFIQAFFVQTVDRNSLTQPTAPRNFNATVVSNNVQLTWDAPLSGSPFAYYGYFNNGVKTVPAVYPHTACTVTNLPNGTYTFQESAYNFQFDGILSTSQTVTITLVPDAPVLTSVTAVIPGGFPTSEGALSIAWNAPVNTYGNPVTKYTVHVYQYIEAVYTEVYTQDVTTPSPPATSVTIKSIALGLGVLNYVTVTATNVNGTSDLSNPISATTFIYPDAPVLNTVTPNGNGQLFISWSPPSSTGGTPVTKYAISVLFSSTQVEYHEVNPPTTTYTTTSLLGQTTYTVQVYAINAIDYSPPSVRGATTGAGRPSAPTLTSVAAADGGFGTNHGALQVQWSPNNSGGYPILNYTVYVYQGATEVLNQPVNAPSTSATISNSLIGLGTTYTVHVTATTPGGTSPNSNQLSATTFSNPGAPVLDSLTASGVGKLNAVWTAPSSDGGTPITKYIVYVYSADHSTLIQRNEVGASPTNYTIIGLNNGVTYLVEVSSVNIVNESAPSDPRTATTLDIPNAPVLNTVTGGVRAVTASWSAPTNTGGGPLVSNSVYVYLGSVELRKLVIGPNFTTYTITDLQEDTTYSIRVSASSEVGEGPLSNELSAKTAGSVSVTANVVPVSSSALTFTQGAYRNAAGTVTKNIAVEKPEGSISPLDKARSWNTNADAGAVAIADPLTGSTTYTSTTGVGFRFCALYLGVALNSGKSQTTYTYNLKKTDGSLFTFNSVALKRTLLPRSLPFLTITTLGTDLFITILPSFFETSGSAVWVVFESATASIGAVSLVSRTMSSAPILITPQAIAFTNNTPPLTCFGAETLILCADGVRRRIADLTSGVKIVAVKPGGCQHVLPAEIYKQLGSNPLEQVYDVAPGVQLTGNHMLLVKGDASTLRASNWACEDCSVIGTYNSCPKCVAENVTVTGYSNVLMRDSTLPHHFAKDIYQIGLGSAYYNNAVVIGKDDTYLAETLRSEADTDHWECI